MAQVEKLRRLLDGMARLLAFTAETDSGPIHPNTIRPFMREYLDITDKRYTGIIDAYQELAKLDEQP